MHFNDSLQIYFQFFVKAVAELSGFTVEKEFKAIRNVLWKYDVVFFDFIFGQTASWKWLYDVYILYIYIYIHIYIYIYWTEIWVWFSFFFSLVFKIVSTLFFFFSGKGNGWCERFYDAFFYPCQPVAVYLFVISVNFSFILEERKLKISKEKISTSTNTLQLDLELDTDSMCA